MSDRLDARNPIQETAIALERVERELAKNPDDWTLAFAAESLRRRQDDPKETIVPFDPSPPDPSAKPVRIGLWRALFPWLLLAALLLLLALLGARQAGAQTATTAQSASTPTRMAGMTDDVAPRPHKSPVVGEVFIRRHHHVWQPLSGLCDAQHALVVVAGGEPHCVALGEPAR